MSNMSVVLLSGQGQIPQYLGYVSINYDIFLYDFKQPVKKVSFRNIFARAHLKEIPSGTLKRVKKPSEGAT